MFEKITRLYHVICKQWRSRTIVSGCPLPLPTTDAVIVFSARDVGMEGRITSDVDDPDPVEDLAGLDSELS